MLMSTADSIAVTSCRTRTGRRNEVGAFLKTFICEAPLIFPCIRDFDDTWGELRISCGKEILEIHLLHSLLKRVKSEMTVPDLQLFVLVKKKKRRVSPSIRFSKSSWYNCYDPLEY